MEALKDEHPHFKRNTITCKTWEVPCAPRSFSVVELCERGLELVGSFEEVGQLCELRFMFVDRRNEANNLEQLWTESEGGLYRVTPKLFAAQPLPLLSLPEP